MSFTRDTFNRIASQIKDTLLYGASTLGTPDALRHTFYWGTPTFEKNHLMLLETQDLKGAWIRSSLFLDMRYDHLGFPELNAHILVADIKAEEPDGITVFVDISNERDAHEQVITNWINQVFQKHNPT